MNLENDLKWNQRTLENSFKKRVSELNKNKVLRVYSDALKSMHQVSWRAKRSLLVKTNALKEKETTDAIPTLDTLHQESKSEKKIRYKTQSPSKNNSLGRGITKKPKNHDFIKFETIKAKSDLLEIKRDLATYDFNFIVAAKTVKKREVLEDHLKDVSSKFSDFDLVTVGNDLMNSIQAVLNNPYSKKPNHAKMRFKTETFQLKLRQKSADLKVFSGFVNISENLVLAKVQSSSLSNHSIHLALGSETGRLIVEKTLTETNAENHGWVIKTDLLRHCFLVHFEGKVIFSYDPLHSLDFSVVSARIKGLGMVSMRLELQEEGVKVNIIKYNLSYFIDYEKVKSFGMQVKNKHLDQDQVKQFQKFLSSFLVYFKKNLSLSEKSEIFAPREENSYLLKEERLSQIFCNYFKQKAKFLLRVKGKQVRVTVLDSSSIKVSIKKREKAYLGPEDISFLERFQQLSVSKNLLTLSKSLELKHLIIKLLKL